MKAAREIQKKKGLVKGQGMVEFMLSLPILLFVIFGIIEFSRLIFSWMAVQNAARFGIRYAVTGEFNETYCIQAGNNLGTDHIDADVFGGDPRDCLVPSDYPAADGNQKERDLIDLARLFSIQDAAVGGGSGLWLDPAVAGDYELFLLSHNTTNLGSTSEKGYLHVTICSNRSNQFAVDYNNHAIPLCMDNLSGQLMDDAGGPGDRVKVHIEHQHPLLLPILNNLWPTISISSERDGIVEKFRTSRVLGVSGPILSAPTWTQTPTLTDTPTITPTSTPSVTPSPSNTPIPVQCDLINVTNSYAGEWFSGYMIVSVSIRNDNPVPIHFYQANQEWQKNDPGRYLWAAQFHTSGWSILNDTEPPTSYIPGSVVEMGAGVQADYIALFMPRYIGLEGDHTVDLEFDDGCFKGVTVSMPTSTPTATPTETATPTITPTPDCSKYILTNFTFRNWAQIRAKFKNKDIVDAQLTYLELDWSYAEQQYALNGQPKLNVDWFKWGGSYFPGHGNGGDNDKSSSTSWSGTRPFSAGGIYRWDIDFDGDGGGKPPMTGLLSSDFGVVAHFDNGCIFVRSAVPRALTTWTPTPTPTRTATASAVPPPTSTSPPTNTPLPSNTPLPTSTPSITPTPTNTRTPSDTPVPSHTSWPSNTPRPTRTSLPTRTPVPPTSTPVTPTLSVTKTDTPIPTWTPACPYDDPGWPCQPTWTPTP